MRPLTANIGSGVCERMEATSSVSNWRSPGDFPSALGFPVVQYIVIRRMYPIYGIVLTKVGIPNFVSGPREYIMEGEYVILAMCSWFRIR